MRYLSHLTMRAGPKQAIVIAAVALLAMGVPALRATKALSPEQSGQWTAQHGNDLSAVQALVSAVHVSEPSELASALGVTPNSAGENSLGADSNSMQVLSDLHSDGTPDCLYNRVRASTGDSPANQPGGWELFLLAWDGAQWRASLVKEGQEPYEARTVALLSPSPREIAVITYSGSRLVPSPAIYQVKDHQAALVWDGAAENSEYQGYPEGQIELRPAAGAESPTMIVSGRGDPGLLHFPKGSSRGFDVRCVYTWDGKAFVPGKTEYFENEDYRLYQFIAALHLRDFRAAYALIDPAKFLKTDAPSLEIFRKKIEESFPEFLDDQIFEARPRASGAGQEFSFELDSDGKHYLYYPSFSADSKFMLTGLERREYGSQ